MNSNNIFTKKNQPINDSNSFLDKEGKSLLSKAIDCLAQRKYQESLVFFDQSIDSEPFNVLVWEKKAIALQRLGRIEEAIEANNVAVQFYASTLEEYLKKKENQLSSHSDHSNSSSEQTNYNVDEEEINRLFKEGIEFYQLGQFSLALEYFDEILEVNPENFNSWNTKGSIFRQMGNLEDALFCFDKALEFNPEFNLAWNNKGDYYYQIGNFKEALICFNKVIEISPDFYLTWYKKGRIHLENQEWNEALNCFNKSLELNSKFPLAWQSKGKVLSHNNEFEKAIICYDQALKFNPHSAEIWNDKGNVFARLNQFENGLFAYNKALEFSDNQLWMAWLNRGILLYPLDGYEAAIQCWEEGLNSLDINHPEYNKACGNLHLQKAKTFFYKAEVKSHNLTDEQKNDLKKALASYYKSLNYFTDSILNFKRLEVLKEAVLVCDYLQFFDKKNIFLQEGTNLFRKLSLHIDSQAKKDSFTKAFKLFSRTDLLTAYKNK